MKISIFGLGYVGSVSAACLAKEGHQVIGVDINETKVSMLNKGEAHIIEPELSALTSQVVAQGKLSATTDVTKAILASELSFICVGTPSQDNNSLDLKYVIQTCESIGSALKQKTDFHVIVCRSTMLPGSIRNVVIPTLEKFSEKKAGKDFSVCINPEFLMEGTAVYDYYHPPKNVVGSTDDIGCKLITELNTSITHLPTICTDIEVAELVKYADNVWHALKVGFANEMGTICKALNIDSHKVMDIFCKDTKLNLSPYYLKPGFAFGGSCLPKDLRALLYKAHSNDLELPILNAIIPSNQLQIGRALKMILALGKKRIGILGLSFKADTDDVRESPMMALIENLLGKGFEISIFDKNVGEAKIHGANRNYLLKSIPHISQLMVESIDDILKQSEIIVIGNKSPEFKDIFPYLQDHHSVIDLVRIAEKIDIRGEYHGIDW